MPKINILAIPPDGHGVGKYRIRDPYIHLQENYPDDFHIDIKTDVPDNDKEFVNYDVIVLHSFIHAKSSNERNIQRIESLKRLGKIVIVDVDDYWDPDYKHPMYLQIIRTGINKKRIDLMKNASYLTVTTPFFRDTIIKKLGITKIQVFPNAVNDKEPQFIPHPTKSDRVRFGWLGGSSHVHDLALIRDGISLIYDNYLDKVQFVLCGFDTRGQITEVDKRTGETKERDIKPAETIWEVYEKYFTKNRTILDPEHLKFLLTYNNFPYDDVNKPYRRRWTMDINRYASNYNLFDVSLAPIVDNIFNNNKSQLKAIESGFFKKALIASDCYPYSIDLINVIDKGGTFNNKGNALLVPPDKNHKQWAQHMKRLIENPSLIEDLGNRLYETVKDKYSLDSVNRERREFFKSIVKK